MPLFPHSDELQPKALVSLLRWADTFFFKSQQQEIVLDLLTVQL